MLPKVPFTASNKVKAAIAKVGRIEDASFSPSGARLALAGFLDDCVLVLEIRVVQTPRGPEVLAVDHLRLTTENMLYPHGAIFLDEETLAVANRQRGVSIVAVPPGRFAGRLVWGQERLYLEGEGEARIETAGSVVLLEEPEGDSLLVCNNFVHKITRHRLRGGDVLRAVEHSVFVARDLHVPDGIAVSHDRRWIAVSNHGAHAIFIYENKPGVNADSLPDAVLLGAGHPHGLAFSPDDRFIVSADAGAPSLHVYARTTERWHDAPAPSATHRVLDEEIFQKGQTGPAEGGPKGVAFDRSGRIVAVTSVLQHLEFFHASDVLGMEAPRRAASA